MKLSLHTDGGALPEAESPAVNLDACPRCGLSIEENIWGQTNCPQCGLHFECC